MKAFDFLCMFVVVAFPAVDIVVVTNSPLPGGNWKRRWDLERKVCPLFKSDD